MARKRSSQDTIRYLAHCRRRNGADSATVTRIIIFVNSASRTGSSTRDRLNLLCATLVPNPRGELVRASWIAEDYDAVRFPLHAPRPDEQITPKRSVIRRPIVTLPLDEVGDYRQTQIANPPEWRLREVQRPGTVVKHALRSDADGECGDLPLPTFLHSRWGRYPFTVNALE
jgi:hypothetical protein